MANKKIYNHTRFDGGITHNKRDTSDLTKLGFISHLDIYRNQNEMSVMPGYVSDNGFGGSATGLKTYNVKNFASTDGVGGAVDKIYALGTKSDGTGSKILQRDITESEWKVPTTASFQPEGTLDLVDHPFFWYDNLAGDFIYPAKSSTNTNLAAHGVFSGGYNGTFLTTWLNVNPTTYTQAITTFDGKAYIFAGDDRTANTGINSLTPNGAGTTYTGVAQSTATTVTSVVSGNYQIGIGGYLRGPRRSRLLIWDSASLLADENMSLEAGQIVALGVPSTVWTGVIGTSNAPIELNGRAFMSVRALLGETVSTIYELEAPTNTNMLMYPIQDTYQGAMLWYGRIPTNEAGDEFIQGVWAFGKRDANSQFGLSLLLDTTSLGLVERPRFFGNSAYFAHGGDGSVSRLASYQTGTYNVPATIETLIYGADSPYQKELNGISIITENLPSGGSVVCSYRTDEDSAWVTMGTSNTVGSQKHSFTKAEGTPIGKFQEIQFKIVITGKVTVKNIMVAITDTADLPF
jgi:hypothetical protein